VLVAGLALLAATLRGRRRAEAEAEQSRAEAEQSRLRAERANQAKSEFLSRMSHELRTPLNAILGFGQLLEMDDMDEGQRESVDQILRAGRHLLDLINEVLDISRIESGRLLLSVEPVDVAEALGEALDLVSPLAAQRGIRIVRPEDTGAFVQADRQRVKQILLNLLSNAVKYNRDGGSITLTSGEWSPGRFRIGVADTGPGIPLEKLTLVFNPFERLGAEETSVEGTGLGLALSKRLAEAMGGSLGVDSSPDAGTTFTLDLAAASDPAKALEERSESSVAPSEGSPVPRTIAYIEDNLSNLALVERILAQRPNLRLLQAMRGAAGIELVRDELPDVVLLDLNLPDIHGAEVLEVLRNDPRTAGIPVVVLTADATGGQRRRLIDAGAAGYLTKPLTVKRFFALLDEVLGRKEPVR
jgi:CheY-like chemotaxis protein